MLRWDVGVLLVLLVASAVAFGAALFMLARRADLQAVLLGAFGALSLRALHRLARVSSGGAG